MILNMNNHLNLSKKYMMDNIQTKTNLILQILLYI